MARFLVPGESASTGHDVGFRSSLRPVNRSQLEQLLDRHGPRRVIEAVGDYVTPARRERIESVLAGRLSSIHVAMEAPSDPHNAAAVVRTPADFYTVRAVLDNQELDSRQSTGAIYWEGLSELIDSNGKRVGSGYLEMTGYAQALRM